MEKKKKAQQKANENKEKKEKAKQARAAAKADQLQATLAGLAAKTYPPFNDDEFVVTSLFNYSEDMKTTGAGIAHYFEDGWATGKICLVPASADYYWVNPSGRSGPRDRRCEYLGTLTQENRILR